MRALRATYFHNCDKGSTPNTAIATGTVTGKSHQCDWGNSCGTLTLACITPLSPTFTCVTSFQTWGDRLNSHRRAKRHTIISGFIEKCGERQRHQLPISLSSLFCILLVIIGNQTIASASVLFEQQPDPNAVQSDPAGFWASAGSSQNHPRRGGRAGFYFFYCTVWLCAKMES